MSDQPDNPLNPKPPQGSEPLDDFFKPTASPTPQGQGGPATYTPPPMQPGQPARRGPNPVIMIIVGVLIGFACICGGCIAVTGGSVFAFLNNPTVQAGINTAQVAFGTGAAMAGAPATLPTDATKKGSIPAGQTKNAQLSSTERQVWTFEGKGGQSITITVTPQDQTLLPMIGIYDTSGKLLDGTSILKTSTNAVLSYSLPADGAYSILVYGLGGTANSNGSYSIVVQ